MTRNGFRGPPRSPMRALVAACGTPPVGMELGAELFETCSRATARRARRPCHQAPAIAGLPQWYIEARSRASGGWRGKHAEDLPGLRMRPMPSP